ncbi:MAG: NUDIX hydrolase [Bacteroidota bacterium]|jgi:8-oxo-dGTP pyrophosphatase MutT (NUDIX family)
MKLHNELLNSLRHQVEQNLPGEMAHIPMAPVSRPLSSMALKGAGDYRRSAVAVVLRTNDDGASLILIQRPDYEGAHSGQISFPGGKMDDTDSSSEETARRECYEEIGLQLGNDALIGKLTDVYIPVSKFLVHPYLYFDQSTADYLLDEREVTEILSFPVHQLISSSSISKMDIKTPQGMLIREVPCFLHGQKKIWGATALVMNELREILLRIL